MEPHFSPLAQDALGETINIGAANAATSLSTLLGATIDIDPPRLALTRIEEVIEFVNAPESVRSMVLLQILGDAPGVMLLVFPEQAAQAIAKTMTKHAASPVMDVLDTSALCEMGNILTGSCITSLQRFLQIALSQSEPNVATDMVGALLSSVLAQLGKENEGVLVAEVRIRMRELGIEGGMFFIFDPQATTTILGATEKIVTRGT